MLTINLQQIVDEINSRRNRIKYQFQELAMLLVTKLGDTRHKSLYMKLAKYEEQELLMDAMHYVLASPNASGNLGALFMWKLKELKNRPIHPVAIRLDIEPEGYYKLGHISGLTRGAMPIVVAGIREFQGDVEKMTVEVGKEPVSQLLPLKTHLEKLLREFESTGTVVMYSQWQWNGSQSLVGGAKREGVLKVGSPVLTKRFLKGRMPSV